MTNLQLGVLMFLGPLGVIIAVGLYQLIRTMVEEMGGKAVVITLAILACMITGLVLMLTSKPYIVTHSGISYLKRP